MKKISRLIASASVLGLGISLALAQTVFAVGLTYSNDVTISLTSPAINLTIEATSTATSVQVNAGTVVAVVPNGSVFRINSTARALLATGATTGTDISISCLTGNKSLVVVTATTTETITFTPDSAACTTSTGGSPSSGGGSPPPAVSAPTASFSANYSSVTSGTAVTLTWSTTNATSVSINQGIGAVATSGTKLVTPTATTTYTLTATGSGGTVTQTATVTVSLVTTPTTPTTPSTPSTPTTPSPTPTTPVNLPNGKLVKVAGSGTVYMVVNGVLRPFNSSAIFNAKGLKFKNVQTISSSVFASAAIGRTVGYPDNTVIKGSGGTLYVVKGDTKVGIPSMAVFKKLKLSLKKVVKLSDADLASYDDGGVAQ